MLHFKVAFLLLLSGRLGHSTLLLFARRALDGTTAAPTYANACDDAVQLSELEKRSRDFTLAFGKSIVNDTSLNKNWYRVSDQKGQYKMPDVLAKIPYDGCGTVNQIYIKGVHPEVLTEEKKYADLCVQTRSVECEPFDFVAIRNCSGELQYFLRPTNKDQAYCFDRPEVQGIEAFSETPTNFFPGVVTVVPQLQWTIKYDHNMPHLVFECSFQQAEGLLYRVEWSVDGDVRFTKGPAETLEELRLSTEDLVAMGVYLGIVLQCSVQASVDKNGLFTSSTTSNEFFAGIQINNPSVILNKTMTSISISFYSTVPIGCVHSVHSASCEHMRLHVQMKNPDNFCSSNLAFQRCSQGIKLLAKNDAEITGIVYDFKVTSNFKFLEPKHLQLLLETDESYPDRFFAGQSLQTVSVVVDHTNSWRPSHCYSHVDPHMKTFDGTYYDNQISNDYVLYKNTKYGIEVQERTKPCNQNNATCTCQVAVRAGGDVFIINRCPATTWLNEFHSCSDGGILDVVKINENKFKIYTPIGTVVEITTGLYEGGSFMNVDIFSSPKDVQNVEGLCGFYDINHLNDLKMSNGLLASDNKKHEFSNSWRVTQVGQGLLLGYTLDNLKKWASFTSLMCVCKQSSEFLTEGVIPENVDEGECDKLDNEACTHSASITNKKCSKIVYNSKRSLSRHAFKAFDEGFFVQTEDPETLTKRQKRAADSDPITEEVVRYQCSNLIQKAPSVTQFPDRLMGENIDEVIEQCVFDVMAADGDLLVAEIHARSLSDVVKQTFSYEPTFVANNTIRIKSFLKETCPSNCSGRGVCSEDGECICATLYHGSECNLYERDPINVALIEGGGVCDTALGDDCRCHWFYTKNLLERFTCKFRRFKVVANSTKLYMDESVVPGYYDDMFTGQCCLPETRNKRSLESGELGYEWELALSNDGLHFGTGLTLYTIDQTCLDVVTNSSTNERKLILKGGYCLINFQCVADTVTLVSDQCRQACSIHVDQFGWSNACEINKEIPTTSIVAIAMGTAVGVAAVVCVSIWICCKLNNKKRLVGIERVTGLENSKPVFPIKGNYNFQKYANAELPEPPVRSYETPRATFYRRDLFEVPADQSGESVHCTTTNAIPSRPGSASGISFVLRANPTDFD